MYISYLFIYLFIHPSIYLCVFFPSKSLSQHGQSAAGVDDNELFAKRRVLSPVTHRFQPKGATPT